MQTKLTLRLDEELIAKAKRWALSRDISLSEAVGQFFAQLPEPNMEPHLSDLSPWVRRLAGIARHPGSTAPTDEEIKRDYYQHLEEKHQ